MHKSAKLLAAGVAATFLSGCSGSASPFEGRTPEEVALFILSGVEKDKSADIPGKGSIKVVTSSEKPQLALELDMTVDGRTYTAFTFATTRNGDCLFTYSLEDSSTRSTVRYVLDADLSGLTSGTQDNPDEVTLVGAKLQCLSSSGAPCKNAQGKLDRGNLPRQWAAAFLTGSSEEISAEVNKRLGDAITYLKDNVCKPKS